MGSGKKEVCGEGGCSEGIRRGKRCPSTAGIGGDEEMGREGGTKVEGKQEEE